MGGWEELIGPSLTHVSLANELARLSSRGCMHANTHPHTHTNTRRKTGRLESIVPSHHLASKEMEQEILKVFAKL